MSDLRAATKSLGAMLRAARRRFCDFRYGSKSTYRGGDIMPVRHSINGHYEPMPVHSSCAKSGPPAPSSHASESCSFPAFVGAPDLVSKLYRPAQQELVQVVCHALCVRTSGGK
jgi:hypothetical protein